jgi:glycosyltransferase involved in cell wall biosynthesis
MSHEPAPCPWFAFSIPFVHLQQKPNEVAMPDSRLEPSENTPSSPPKVAVIIPCHNEEQAIGKVVSEFKEILPDSDIVVIDNASTDKTAEQATVAGARIVREMRLGKGHAMLTGFHAAGDADYFVMIDGDDTYSAREAPALLEVAQTGIDMVVGTRLHTKRGRRIQHQPLSRQSPVHLPNPLAVRHSHPRPVFGYRVLSKRFLSNIPITSKGFEIEAELTMQAQTAGFPVAEIPVSYGPRAENSESKLKSYRDGYRILLAIVAYFRDNRPLMMFGLIGLFLYAIALFAGGVVVNEYVHTQMVTRIPLAVLAATTFLLATLSVACGIILHSINRRTTEIMSLVTWNLRRLK